MQSAGSILSSDLHYWLDWYSLEGPLPVANVTCRRQSWAYYGLEPFMHSFTAHADWYTPECSPGLELSYNWAPCVGCSIPDSVQNSPVINLRGLCAISEFDSEYTSQQAEDGYIMYIGASSTIIEYVKNSSNWIMKSMNHQNFWVFIHFDITHSLKFY